MEPVDDIITLETVRTDGIAGLYVAVKSLRQGFRHTEFQILVTV